jgi:glutathione S-transferase
MMLTIWGRANSVNVQKVLWLCDELSLPFDRIDAGMQHGRNKDADYLAMNPNGRVPTLVDKDFVLWESNSILRYLALQYGGDTDLYSNLPPVRASIDRWLDWTLSTLAPSERTVFVALVRTSALQRDMATLEADFRSVGVHWAMLDKYLASRRWIEGDHFSIGDIALGTYARRWFGLQGVERPDLPALASWYERIAVRAGFQRHIAVPLS